MPRRTVDLNVLAPYQKLLPRMWLRRVALRAMDVAAPGEALALSVTMTNDDTVRALNRQYRGLDDTTDVLAFSATHPGHWEGDGTPPADSTSPAAFVMPPGEQEPLGEVVVSVPQAQRQAQAAGHGLDQEVALLITHGVLHLAGYDHVEIEETAAMQAKEREALAQLAPAAAPR